MIPATASAKTSPGNASIISAIRIIAESTKPLKYPAKTPIIVPTKNTKPTTPNVDAREILAPYITLANMSLPILSVPKMCSFEGSKRAFEILPLRGSTPPVTIGANIATRTIRHAKNKNKVNCLFAFKNFTTFIELLLYSHTRIYIHIRCIYKQIYRHINQTHPQHISLN